MTWQDELRRLDDDMAAGRVSVDDYRRRRDELTAQSRDQHSNTERSGAEADQDNTATPEPDNTATADQDSTAEQPKGDEGANPFPPAFRWEGPSPNETTQVIEPLDSGDAERTQVVRTPAQPQPSPPYDDSERTQVVQVGPPAPSPYGQPTYQSGGFPPGGGQDPWAQQESAPPWMSSDPPPIQEPNAGWMMQGPEFFEPEKKESGVGRIVAIAAAVVVLVGIAVGAWLLWGQQSSPVATDQPTGQPAAPAPEPEDPLAPADVGGLREAKDVESFGDLEAVGFLTTEELGTLEAAGAAESRLLITNFDQGKATILVCRAASPALATNARDELTALQLGYGFTRRTAPPGVNSVVLGKPDTEPTLRALFASGNLVIRVQMVSNNPGDSPTITTAKFEEILEKQLEKLPADA